MYKNNLNGIMAFARGGRIPQQLNFGFDFMNTGNPSENMYYNSDGTYNNGLKSQGIINQDINQMAFRPGSMKDRGLKQLDVMPDMDQKRYDNLRKEDVDQFNEKGIPLSLPNDRYKGIEGFTSSLGNFFFSPAGAAEINPNNTFTSSVANSPYEMDYMPPNRYTDFEPRVGQDKFNIMNPTAEEKLSLFQRGKDLASSGIGKAGKLGMDAFNMLKNNNPLSYISSLANTRNPLNPGSSNYDSNLQDQIDSLKGQTGTRITGTSDNLKFTDGLSMINDNKYGLGSVLAGKNVTSGFGTNNYEVSLQNFIDKMMGYKTRSKFQQAKLDRAKRELAAEQSRQQSALEAQLAAAARESARMGYQDYGSGAASQSTQDSYQGSDGNYAGASTQDYDTPD